jgi:hypothetical protein
MNPSQPLPTIAIVNKDSKSGFSLINENAFDRGIHEKFKGNAVPEPKPPADPIDNMDKDAVISDLRGRSAEFNKNLGVNKLRAILRASIADNGE